MPYNNCGHTYHLGVLVWMTGKGKRYYYLLSGVLGFVLTPNTYIFLKSETNPKVWK